MRASSLIAVGLLALLLGGCGGAGAGDDPVAAGERIFNQQGCLSCHAVGPRGGNVGPRLDGISERMTDAELLAFLRNPQAVRPGAAMPRPLVDEEGLQRLVAYLQSLE